MLSTFTCDETVANLIEPATTVSLLCKLGLNMIKQVVTWCVFFLYSCGMAQCFPAVSSKKLLDKIKRISCFQFQCVGLITDKTEKYK